jgi:polyisoprenoid-binding protein YceI
VRTRSIALALPLLLAAACGGGDDRAATTETAEPAPPPAAIEAPAADTAAADLGVETIQLSPRNTEITFVGTRMVGRHDGGFRQFSGTLHLDAAAPENSHLTLEIDTPSIWSDTDKLTGHLKSDDFFAVERYPKATFESTSIEPADGAEVTHTVRGNLTIRDRTREIAIPLKVDLGDDQVTANGTFTIDRQQFDIKYPGSPDNLIHDKVTVKVRVEAPRAAAAT